MERHEHFVLVGSSIRSTYSNDDSWMRYLGELQCGSVREEHAHGKVGSPNWDASSEIDDITRGQRVSRVEHDRVTVDDVALFIGDCDIDRRNQRRLVKDDTFVGK